jgi:hypothetical protein
MFYYIAFLFFLFNNNHIYTKLCKKHAAILNILPSLRIHDIVVVPDNNAILTIDYTPINQSHPDVLLKLFMGKYVPAEVRIRRMRLWNLTEWYNTPCISVDDINNNVSRNKIIKVVNNWNHNDVDMGNSNIIGMNLYKRNCKHFSNFVIENFDI